MTDQERERIARLRREVLALTRAERSDSEQAVGRLLAGYLAPAMDHEVESLVAGGLRQLQDVVATLRSRAAGVLAHTLRLPADSDAFCKKCGGCLVLGFCTDLECDKAHHLQECPLGPASAGPSHCTCSAADLTRGLRLDHLEGWRQEHAELTHTLLDAWTEEKGNWFCTMARNEAHTYQVRVQFRGDTTDICEAVVAELR